MSFIVVSDDSFKKKMVLEDLEHLHIMLPIRETQIAPFPLCPRDGDQLVMCTGCIASVLVR